MMNGSAGRHAGPGMPQQPDVGRRRPYNPHPHHPHPQQQQHQGYPPQMYNNYMQQPYGASYYQQQMAPQYHNGPMHHQYPQYPPSPYPNMRSPPPPLPMQHYGPTLISQQHQPMYPRPQSSASMPNPYQTSLPQALPSTQLIPAAIPMTPPTPALAVSVPPKVRLPEVPPLPAEEIHDEVKELAGNAPEPAQVATEEVLEDATEIALPVKEEEPSTYIQLRPYLPWYSHPKSTFPARRVRRKRKIVQGLSAELVELPEIAQAPATEPQVESEAALNTVQSVVDACEEINNVRPETPAPSLPPSEDNNSTNPTTPSSSQQQYVQSAGDITPVAPKLANRQSGPIVPIVPVLPKSLPKTIPQKSSVAAPIQEQPITLPGEVIAKDTTTPDSESVAGETKETVPAPKAWTTPKLWTGLFNPDAPTSTAASSESEQAVAPNGLKPSSESLAEALRTFSPLASDAKVSFLEPRGLVNTGNMCYMNSVLQVLVFCGPFYNFLDQVSRRAAHSFKSETPLIDAMILFMREFKVIDSAANTEKLRLRLKEGELERYGDSFTPDFVYNVINRLPRFSSMRQGHQQDAEEFLGFLLDGLHEECVHVMRSSVSANPSALATPTNGPSSPISEVNSTSESMSGQENGWLEVGPKQKAAVTRSSGTITTGSPLTKIFGGNLRSELRVPGLKDSVTLEPYQPLQLDIGAPNVNNIVDALKGLTRSETLNGDFKSPKGPNVTATKQVFIETLPPVLILHLKRFQYDNAGGTQKIWKKVGYPLELEIPKEVFSRQKRGVYAHSGLPKYRLIGAVYHHGKNASGGHYTVDVRRQEGREWIRLDDTVIRRVRSEEVAEGGSEEDPKVIAAALEAHSKDGSISVNGFAAIDGAEEDNNEDGWKKASGSGKKWSAVANGASTPKAKSDKFSVKDNKVAYLLFYQKI